MKILYKLITWGEYGSITIIGKLYKLLTKSSFSYVGDKVDFFGWPFITGVDKIEIGDNVGIERGAFIRAEGGLEIGNNCSVAANVSIYTYNHNYESETLPYDHTNIYRKVIINDNVWIGRNVSILPGVTVGEGAIIGMSSVVTKDVLPLAIVGGNPAKVLKMRNTEHYYRLLKSRKFRIKKSLLSYIKEKLF